MTKLVRKLQKILDLVYTKNMALQTKNLYTQYLNNVSQISKECYQVCSMFGKFLQNKTEHFLWITV